MVMQDNRNSCEKIDDEHQYELLKVPEEQQSFPSQSIQPSVFFKWQTKWFYIVLLLVLTNMISIVVLYSYFKTNQTNEFVENDLNLNSIQSRLKSVETQQRSKRDDRSGKYSMDPPDDIGHMNVYMRKSSRVGNEKSLQRRRFPVARYNYDHFPFTGPFISFMPRIPIYVHRLTQQTIIYSPIGGVYIIPPLINMYGKMFSVGELIACGYASLVSTGGGPINPINIGNIFQPLPLLGLNIPTINPMTGGFTGGIRSDYRWSSIPKLSERFVDDLSSDYSQYDNYEQSSKYSENNYQKSKNKYYNKVKNGNRNRFESIIVFGDALSDTGNIYKLSNHTWPIVPPYYKGRFCDNLIWVDRLEGSNIQNYAYGSATSDNNVAQGYAKFNTIPVPGIRQQITMYLNKNPIDKINFASTLFIIWGGANDFLVKQTLTPEEIVNSLMNSVKYLLSIGAKYILVFNQTPIQAIPLIRALNKDVFFTAYTLRGNNALMANMTTIQQNNTKAYLYIFDTNTLITKLLSNHSTVFTNTVDECWFAVNVSYVEIFCESPSKYLFIDEFHFTHRVHQFIADGIKPLLSSKYKAKNNEDYILAV